MFWVHSGCGLLSVILFFMRSPTPTFDYLMRSHLMKDGRTKASRTIWSRMLLTQKNSEFIPLLSVSLYLLLIRVLPSFNANQMPLKIANPIHPSGIRREHLFRYTEN
ncbi:hypothetical protein BDN70DRAFT_871583 [Pholiota conissans]|uniref:Uncharacterized protein n=1 Tax=Pholiota conissans TaxID=109636 RepID=A0A9P5ZFZ1_9AGAR|nr:hypothetical protein BDN70DRAFT_871583 [Pholiota conissans]